MNDLIKDIINKHYIPIDESKGTFTLEIDDNGNIVENKQLLDLLSNIYDDIINKRYLSNKVINYDDIVEIEQVNANHVYKLTYSTNLDWLNNLIVFVVDTDDNSIRGLSYFESKKFTFVSNKKYESAAFGLFNPEKNLIIEDTIIHELKHLYISLMHNDIIKNDIDIVEYNKKCHAFENIDFKLLSKTDIDKRSKDNKFIRSALFRMLYDLNAEEIEAHKENICMSIKRSVSNNKEISYEDVCELGILKTYKNMQYILDILRINKDAYAIINRPHIIDTYKSIFKTHSRKSNNANFIINKFQSKINSILKHTRNQYEFWKHFYNN